MIVFKYAANIDPDFAVLMPVGAQILSVALQAGKPVLWALVETGAEREARRFHWRATGQSADGLGRFVGTVLMHSGSLVFHLFEAAL